ncbi:putative odorant receptor 83c [Ochlerotatus camptorhynchus]|uniref:putative odorant receptor 83c n=1 Tax=Ochlerotatus camptorhynchus TaxID=644619 RepID=UPI0031DB23E1
MKSSESPLESFERILNWQHLILKLIGCDGFSPEFRFTALTFLFVFLAGLFMVISFIDLYLFRDDVFNFTFVMVTIFYALIGVGRLKILLRHPIAASNLVRKMKQVYREASSDGSERLVILKYTTVLKHCVIFYGVIFLGGVILAGLLPLVVYMWNGDKILPFGVLIPFVNPETADGYELNFMYQVSCMLWTPPALTASQNFYFALVFNICIQYDVLVLKLQNLDDLIAKNVNGKLDGQIRDVLINIIQYQQRLIIMTFFVLHIDMWFPGYLVILVSTFQLFLCCMMGTLIDVKSDVFTDKIYNISWHAMAKGDQRMLKFMLEKSQQSLKLSCGGMMTVNMNLFLAVYKKIYSIFMMLQNI